MKSQESAPLWSRHNNGSWVTTVQTEVILHQTDNNKTRFCFSASEKSKHKFHILLVSVFVAWRDGLPAVASWGKLWTHVQDRTTNWCEWHRTLERVTQVAPSYCLYSKLPNMNIYLDFRRKEISKILLSCQPTSKIERLFH